MEQSLELTHSRWCDKANTPYIECDVYYIFKISFAFLACHHSNNVEDLMNEDTTQFSTQL